MCSVQLTRLTQQSAPLWDRVNNGNPEGFGPLPRVVHAEHGGGFLSSPGRSHGPWSLGSNVSVVTEDNPDWKLLTWIGKGDYTMG